MVLTSPAKDYIKESHNDDVLLEQETFVLNVSLPDVIFEDESIGLRENGEGLWVEHP